MATAISLVSESGLVMWIVYIVFSASCYKRTIGNALRVYLLYRYKCVYILLHCQCIPIEPDLAPFALHYFSWDATISFHQDLVLGVPGSRGTKLTCAYAPWLEWKNPWWYLCPFHQRTLKLELLKWWPFDNIVNAFLKLFASRQILQVVIFLSAS